jgi:hypothetical protein
MFKIYKMYKILLKIKSNLNNIDYIKLLGNNNFNLSKAIFPMALLSSVVTIFSYLIPTIYRYTKNPKILPNNKKYSYRI